MIVQIVDRIMSQVDNIMGQVDKSLESSWLTSQIDNCCELGVKPIGIGNYVYEVWSDVDGFRHQVDGRKRQVDGIWTQVDGVRNQVQ